MKKLYFLIVLFLLSSLLAHGQTVLSENFEGGTDESWLPAGWSVIDANNDNRNWRFHTYSGKGAKVHSGDGCMISDSWYSGLGACAPDNWLITPAVTLPEDAVLSFWVVAQDASWAGEHWGVYISTNGGLSTSDFTLLYEASSAPSSYEQKTINLGLYAGQNVRIAFRHFNCSNQWWLNIDDVVITNDSSTGGGTTPVDPEPSDNCALQIHLERTLGYSSSTYSVYYTVNDDWSNRQLLELDPSTASFDTTLLLPPSTMFELWGSTGGSDFNCQIIDGSGGVYTGSYYPNYKTLDACSPVCNLYVTYGCGDTLLTISEPRWIKIYAGDNNTNTWDYLYQSSWTAVGRTYGTMIPVTAGVPLHFVWTEPDEVNHNSFFVLRDNATNQELFRKNAGEVLPNGEFLIYTPNCGSCGASDRCPLTIHLERNANDPNHPGEYILEYYVGHDYNASHEIHLGPSESSKDTTLMLCPEIPFELYTKWESSVGTYGGSDFSASFENAYGNVVYDGYAPSYTTEDPCARSCEYALRVGAATNLLSVSSTWFEIFEGSSTTPSRTIGLANYTSGSTYYWSIPVMAGKTYRFVWHEPDPENHATFFNLRDQDDQVIFEKTSYSVLPDGEFLVVTPTCQAVLITTDPVTNIHEHAAQCGGTVHTNAIDNYNISYGIDYGICYGTTPNPTVSGTHTTSHSYSSGNFSFTHTMSSLQDNTTYYVRAYVTYMGETTYGDVLQFTTPQAIFCQTPSSVNGYGLTGSSALVTWTVQNVTMPIESYTLQYKKASDADWSDEISVADTQYVLNGLLSSTEYNVRVRSVCESTTSSWKTGTFTTPVALMDHLYVSTSGSGDGSSWTNAMGSLSDALRLAADIHQMYDTTVTIWVAAGTYYGDVDSTNAFKMYEGVNVFGGFAGNEPDNYDLANRDFTTNATILDGQNRHRVLYQVGNPTKIAIWDGFTIQNGHVSYVYGDVYSACGGGAFLVQAFEMRNCRFLHHYSEREGGAVYLKPALSTSIFKFTNCEFSYNQADYYCGAVCFNSSVYDNFDVDSLDLSLEFHKCDFLHNVSSENSAVMDWRGLLKFYDCKFKYNSAVSPSSGATYSGTIEGGRLFVNCEISHNRANEYAGLSNSTASLLNCIIVNNEDVNSYHAFSSGLFNFRGVMTNCVVWGNKVDGVPINIYSTIYGYDEMLIQNSAIEGGFNFEGNPNNTFITLESENYGYEAGRNYPFFASPESGDYRPRGQSALVNAGVEYPDMPTQDLAGEARVYGGTIDIGCYEYQGEDYCIAPVLLVAQNIYGTSATIAWQNANPNEPLYYELSYKQENEATWTVYPEQLHTTWAMLTGLQPQTTYLVRLRTFCDAGHTSEYTPELSFTTTCMNGYIHTAILNGESDRYWTFNGLPFDEDYSYSQQIFRAGEIGAAGTIDTIYLQHNQTSQVAVRNVDIYMAHTLRSSFETDYDWIPFDQLTLVYSGEITVDCAADGTWIPIPLQSPFDYNGENNLVLAFDDNTGSRKYNYDGFKSHKTENNACIYTYSINLDVDPTSFSTSSSIGTECLNVVFASLCATDGCDKANVSVMDVTPTSATLAFTQGTNATACELQYREVGMESFIMLPVSNSPFVLQNLKQNTEYEVRIRSKCGYDYGTWKSVLFRTEVKQLSKMYVTTTGNGDGSSWTDATNDFIWALETAELMKQAFGVAPDIWVAEGTYYGDTLHSDAFFMKEGVNVYGGFVGNEAEDFDLSQRDFAHHASILDGKNQRCVLNQRDEFVERTTWDGFTIQHGYLDQYGDDAAGAYLRGSVSLYNCVITENNGGNSGVGGILCEGSSHRIYNGVYQTVYDSVYIRNCVISHNTRGGADLGQYVLAENCVFEYNTTDGNGGGVRLYGAILRNSIVRYNTAIEEYYYYNELNYRGSGGGVIAASNSIVENCEITHNVAAIGGGVCDETQGNNSNRDYKSGIFNCLIANNTAHKGGGVYCDDYSLVVGSTIVNNMIESEDEEDLGAGVLGEYNTKLLNCIIWGNKRNGVPEGYVHNNTDYVVFDADHVASDVAIEGEHNILLLSESYANGIFSPRFVHPAETVGADDVTENVDWHLLPGSACINRGDTLVFGTTDLDGLARVQQDTVDLGCYESAYYSVTLPALPDSIVYVKEGGAGNGLGDCWENATASLTDAINIAALNRAQVWVAAGTYYGANASAENAFEMKQGINVYGGFEGNEPPSFPLDERDFEHNVSILDGQQQQRVLYQTQDFIAADSVIWDGFTIQNGRTTGNGAGVLMRKYSSLKNCIVQNNVIEGYGEKRGSGIYVYKESYYGDGYYHLSGISKISHCKIINNGTEITTATIYGGGLYAYLVDIDHTEIAHNAASYGGGIYAYQHVPMSNCLIHNNKASERGGGVYVAYKDVGMVNCDIVKNTVTSNNRGGGLYNEFSNWGWWNEEDTLLMKNCIVWGNKFEGVDNNWQSPTYQEEVSIPDNIVQADDINTSMRYCAVEGGHVGTGNVMLAPENDRFNGEQQYVRFMDVAHENFRLHPLSACVNKGSNDFVDAELDFYGNMRISDSLVDIGCAEAGELECLPVTSVTVTVDCDSVELMWNRVSMENQWQLSYGEEGAEPTVILLNDTNYTIYDLPRGKNYTAFVRSVCSAEKQSDPSSSANFRTPLCLPDVIVCTPVPSMTADVQCDSIILTWSRGENEEQWLVSYGETDATLTELLVNDTVCVLKNLTYNHNYTAYVFAVCNDTLMSDTSVWVSFTPQDCILAECPALTGLEVEVKCDSVVLRWNREEGVGTWVVTYGQVGEEYVTDTVYDNIYVLTGLPLDVFYNASVFALCNHNTLAGESSSLITFKTQCMQDQYYPDLHVTQINNSVPYTRNPMTVTWTVKNDGRAATPPGETWTDWIWLSNQAEVSMGDGFGNISALLDTVPNMQSLEPGESYTNTATVHIPNGYEGSYYLFVLTDADAAFDINYSLTGSAGAPDPYTPSISGDPYPYLSGSIRYHTSNVIREEEGKDNDNFFYKVLTITPPPVPDLVVTNIAHPTDVYSGNEISLTWTVVNQGGQVAENSWKDRLYITKDSVLMMNNALLLGEYQFVGSLLPDSSYQQTVQVTIPVQYRGDYHIFVCTDQSNSIYESIWETNNQSISPQILHVTFSPYPDLVVTDIDMPTEVAANEEYDCRVTITNMGIGPNILTNCMDAFFLTRDTTPTGHPSFARKTNVIGILYPGESYQYVERIKIPFGIHGEWNLFVHTNSDNAIFEYNADTNNVSEIRLTVVPPDLTVTNVTIPDTAWSGTRIPLTYTLKNLSGGTASVPGLSRETTMVDNIYFGTSPDSYENGDVTYVGSYKHEDGFRLEVGAERTYTETVMVPNGVDGPGYFFVVCNDDEIQFENGQIANNVGASEEIFTFLSPWPDIKVTSLTNPELTYLGCPFSIEYTIRNDGIAGMNPTRVHQVFYASNSPAMFNPMADPLVVLCDTLALAVGEEIHKTASVIMGIDDYVEDFYYLHMLVDAADVVYEYSGENNNYLVSNQYEARMYPLDMAIMEMTGPDTIAWGDTVTWMLKVKNLSDLPSIDTLVNEIFISDNQSLNPGSDLLLMSEMHVQPVSSGEELIYEFTYVVPLGSPSKAYLFACVDREKNNPDIDLSNNTLVKELTINSVPVPDLSIVDAYVLDEVYCGQPARLAYKVRNISESPIVLQTWNDKLRWNKNGSATETPEELLTVARMSMSLNQNEIYVDTVEFTIPQPYSGGRTLYLTVNDEGNSMYEFYRRNNKASIPIQVYRHLPGDLIVTDVTSDNTVVSGEQLHVQWNIQNVGTNPMEGRGLKTMVYISVDTLFDAGDRFLGSVTSSIDLAVGASVSQSLNSRVSGISYGEYYLIIKTDVTNAFNEDDENNNSTCSANTFEVTVRPLPFNTDVPDFLVNDEVSDFQMTVGEHTRQTVRIHLHSEDSLRGAVNQIYATHNQMGNNLNYTYSTVGQYTANPELYIPSTQAGYYGVNVYGYTPYNDGAQSTILRADTLPFVLMSVNANHGGNTGEMTMELTGSRFRPDMRVCLQNANDTICADTVIFESYYQVYAHFNLAGKGTGVYDVSALNFCEGESVLPDAFTIEETSPYSLGYDLVFPVSPRPNRNVVLMLEFGNIGNVDLHNQVLEVTSNGGCPIALTPEEVGLDQKVLRIPLNIDGEPEGLLRPGIYGVINIYSNTSYPLLFSIKPVKSVVE